MRRSIAEMRMDDALLFKQFDSDTALPGRMTFHTVFVDPTVRHVGPIIGPRVVRVDAGRRVLRSACRTRVHDLGCEVR